MSVDLGLTAGLGNRPNGRRDLLRATMLRHRLVIKIAVRDEVPNEATRLEVDKELESLNQDGSVTEGRNFWPVIRHCLSPRCRCRI